LAGLNIFELDTIPTAIDNSIAITINANPYLPTNDDDFIDVELDYIDPIANYCLHLAQIKTSPATLVGTQSYLEDFVKTALGHNIKLQERGLTYEKLMGITKKENIENPKLVEEPA
jgi:hypothetical protein